MPKAISDSKRNSILAGLDAGHSVTRIRADCGISPSTVTKVRAEHRPELAKSSGGRPRKLSPTAVRYGVRLVTHDNPVSTAQATQALANISGQSIHPQTVRRALKAAGFLCRGT
ncbi:hypothetical protein FRC08_012081 [Ceratobasidium sp. 394]|nr:hypothetical protein FRC08_012081 [Ceratobasidium sp. 394]KAG9077346.1 hypothetical protein FS749_010781 [Ceratobasidium sp. UAMH 11750]